MEQRNGRGASACYLLPGLMGMIFFSGRLEAVGRCVELVSLYYGEGPSKHGNVG